MTSVKIFHLCIFSIQGKYHYEGATTSLLFCFKWFASVFVAVEQEDKHIAVFSLLFVAK